MYGVRELFSVAAPLDTRTLNEQVQEFITKYGDDYPGLEVRYPNGAKPFLTLLNDDENELDAISITGWNTDAIRDYLNENIKS